ncbi:hypothetical protein RvY_09911 [Ramazzottius varieornatus]|uniref:Peptidase metallopeptidase domain-containing protein n=1 Tax=Ramazzottius varieornatus TaxID=947166 RepID=A0A1D1VJZ5_RAMVA|nr:hypothetical protein RvY_09911 [Ramazzottius varieornatus]
MGRECWPFIMNIGIGFLVQISILAQILLEAVRLDAASLSAALKYLQKFGYIDHGSDGQFMAAQLHMDDFISAIKKFQRFSGLQVTGKMDATTAFRMKQPRCGNPDPVHRDPHSRAFILQGSKWDKLDLTFKIGQYSRTLSRKAVDEIIGKAFSYWSKPSGLTFTQIESGTADIVILFARGEHGDLSPFDGPQGVLAHAFFPDFGGDTHFDDSERWTQSARNGVNLLQVAVHELGHALGLDHSDVTAAVMAPFYDGFNPKFELHIDDIAGIRRLYPLRDGVTGATESSNNFEETETPSPTKPMTPATTRSPFRTRFSTPRASSGYPTRPPRTSTTASPTQNTTVTSFAVTRSSVRHTTPLYYDVNQPPELLDDDILPSKGPPPTLSSSSTSSTTVLPAHNATDIKLITANEFTEFDMVAEVVTAQADIGNATVSSTTSKSVSEDCPDLCSDNFTIDALTTSDGIGYLFSGECYWAISSMGEVLLPGRKISADWGGVPGNLNAALTPSWANGRTYFFKGSWYWRVTERKIDSGYPKLIRSSWGGIPDDIDAAFQWGKNSRTYFVKRNQIWSFDRTKLPPVRGPKPLPVDRGFPQHIDAGFRSSNGRTYLFSKDKYYAMSTWSFLISRYYPQPTAPRWFGCGLLPVDSDLPKDQLTRVDPSTSLRDDFDVSNRTTTSAPLSALHFALFPLP